MRIVDTASGQTIERPLDYGLRRDLARRICQIKGIKGPMPKPARYKGKRPNKAH